MGNQNLPPDLDPLPSDSDQFLSYTDPLSPDSTSPEGMVYTALKLLLDFLPNLNSEIVLRFILDHFEYLLSKMLEVLRVLGEKLGLSIDVDIIMYKEIIGDLDIVRDTAIIGDVTIRGNLNIMPDADLHILPHSNLNVVLN